MIWLFYREEFAIKKSGLKDFVRHTTKSIGFTRIVRTVTSAVGLSLMSYKIYVARLCQYIPDIQYIRVKALQEADRDLENVEKL